jgi:hypothetical protein
MNPLAVPAHAEKGGENGICRQCATTLFNKPNYKVRLLCHTCPVYIGMQAEFLRDPFALKIVFQELDWISRLLIPRRNHFLLTYNTSWLRDLFVL